MNIHEITAKHILIKTKIPGADYVINHYSGCSFGCVYCYARFVCRWRKGSEKWGDFVDVKTNAPELLEKEIDGKKGAVVLSTVSDPYQPVEAKYKLTRRMLQILGKSDLSVSVLTKSVLAERDIDVFLETDAEVGVSIGTLKKNLFEPIAPPPERRAELLKKLKREGVRTYLFIGPIFPGLTDLERMFSELAEYTDRILLEDLNLSPNRKGIMEVAGKMGIGDSIKSAGKEYWPDMKEKALDLGKQYGVPVEVYFKHTGDLRF